MKVFFLIRLLLATLLASAVTGGIYFWDQKRISQSEIDFGLRLAQQTVFQVQTLRQKAREKQEADSLNWVIQTLGVGSEFRPVQVSAFKLEEPLKEEEKYKLNLKTGTFSYVRALNNDNKEAIRIHILLGFKGFLGARTLLSNDIFCGVTFLLFFSIFYFALIGFSSKKQNQSSLENMKSTVPSLPSASELLMVRIHVWIDESKAALMNLGKSIRDLTRQAQVLARAAFESRRRIEELLEIQAQLKEKIQKLEEFTQSENVSLELKEAHSRLKENFEQCSILSQDAHQFYRDINDITKQLNQYVTDSKEGLLSEVKLIQILKDALPAASSSSETQKNKAA